MKDYLKKQPTQVEKQLAYQLGQIYRSMDNTNAMLIAMARKLFTPEELAAMRVDDKANQEFADQLADALKAQDETPQVAVSEETKETINKAKVD